jgi:hypothetical protein
MGQNAGQADAAAVQKAQAQHASDLFNIGAPGFQLALGDLIKDLGQPGQIPASVKTAFDQMTSQTNQQFSQEEAASPLAVGQQMKQSGYRGAIGAEDYTSGKVLASLEQGRKSALNNLQIQEVNQGLAQQQFDLQNIFGLVGTGMGQSNQFAANALQATGYNQQGGYGNVLAGGLAGAGAGAAAGPYGALAGLLIGAGAGYFGSR